MILVKNVGKKLLVWDMKPEAWIEYGYYQAGGWFLVIRLPSYKCISNWLTRKPIMRQKTFICRTYGKTYDCSGLYIGTAWIGPDGLEDEN